MPRYIIEREVGSLTLEEIQAVGRRSNEVLDEMGSVVWIRSYVSDHRPVLLQIRIPKRQMIGVDGDEPEPGISGS